VQILVVTACGGKKNSESMVAHRLYKSSRITAVYNRRSDCDMAILSAEYGLVGAEEVIAPYERVMDEGRAQELVPSVSKKLQSYDCVIFFKGGARKAYLRCLKDSCQRVGKLLVALGYANMGGINDLPKAIDYVKKGKFDALSNIHHLDIYDFFD